MLCIVILPAAVSPANIISQKPSGFYITFRKGKHHSGQSPEYHFLFRGHSERRILSPKTSIPVFGSYKKKAAQVLHCLFSYEASPVARIFDDSIRSGSIFFAHKSSASVSSRSITPSSMMPRSSAMIFGFLNVRFTASKKSVFGPSSHCPSLAVSASAGTAQ